VPCTAHAHNVAVTAIYIRLGLGDGLPQSLFDHHSGHIGVDDQVAEYAVLSYELCEKLQPLDWPGVYDYEVSEPFGTWLRNRVDQGDNLPALYIALPKMVEMIAEFFAQNAPDDELSRAMAKANLMEELK
jgi:hypothetical protein